MRGILKNFWRRTPKWLLAIVTLLIVARLALPWFLLREVNGVIASIPGYRGGVKSVSVSLWRGAYGIHGLRLFKAHGLEDQPFLAIQTVDIALDWRALLHRKLVTRIELIRPELQFVQRSSPEKSQTSIDGSWQEKVEKLYPFTINRFLIFHGRVGYRDETTKPRVNLSFREIESDVENITNANHSNGDLPSSVAIRAQALNSGAFELRADVNFLADPFTANIKGSLHHLALVDFNEFSRAYGHFDFKGGDLQVTFEAAATPTRYRGYAKTLLHHVKIFDWSKDDTSVGHLLWQGVAAVIVDIFTNGRRDQFAAKIPFDGSRKDLKVEKWETFVSICRNAFVTALSPKFEDIVEVKANSVR